MEDENKIKGSDEAKGKNRRKFIKSAAEIAASAPAVVMLLNASTKPAAALTLYDGRVVCEDNSDQGADCFIVD